MWQSTVSSCAEMTLLWERTVVTKYGFVTSDSISNLISPTLVDNLMFLCHSPPPAHLTQNAFLRCSLNLESKWFYFFFKWSFQMFLNTCFLVPKWDNVNLHPLCLDVLTLNRQCPYLIQSCRTLNPWNNERKWNHRADKKCWEGAQAELKYTTGLTVIPSIDTGSGRHYALT